MLTLLNPWSCTPTWETWGAIRSTVAVRPRSRNSAAPVASNCRMSEPYWNPCVHSVQPREVQRPPAVNTGDPFAAS